MAKKDEFLTSNQLTFLLVGFALGPEFLKLPNNLVKTAKQDAWIAAMLGLVYPIYIILISSYIIKKYPKNNLLNISKNIFGKVFGSILNFLFLFQFILITSTVSEEFISFSMIYIASFLNPVKITIVAIVLSTYAAYSGLKTLGKLSEIAGYFIIVIILFSLTALQYGSFLNVQPVLGSGWSNIFRATIDTLYSYTGFEVILLLHPYVEDVNTVKGAGLKSIVISGSMWVWTVFATIFYLGPDIIPKTNWGFIWTFESVNLPIINNFRYIFVFVWIIVTLRMIANFLFASAFIINDFFRKSINKVYLYLSPFVFILTLFLTRDYYKVNLIKATIPIIVIYNIIFVTSVAIAIAIKTNLKVHNNQKS